MLYRVFKWLFYLTVRGYFRSIHFKGRSNVPQIGPVIFVANHNSAFMDPILLAVHLKRSLYFLARGESFKSKLASIFFGWLHMIPIYRPEITPDKVHKNKQIFQRCFDHLGMGKAIMIFPEGVSETVRRLRHIKTGAARIALGAEQQNNFELGVKIIPIGINYSNPHFFMSDVFVSIGTAIELKEYYAQYTSDSKAAVRGLTHEIEIRLGKLLVGVEEQSVSQLIKDIERLYRNKLREELAPDHKAEQDFYLSRKIAKAVSYYKKTRPDETNKFENSIRLYFQTLEQLNISDIEFRKPGQYIQPRWPIIYFAIGFPLLVYGYTVNILPYKTAEILSRKIIVRKDFIGSMKLAFGMFIFLLFYILEISLFTYFTNWILGLVFIISLFPSGLFAVKYINQWHRYKSHLNFLKLKRNNQNTIHQLQSLREELLTELEKGRQMYLQRNS